MQRHLVSMQPHCNTTQLWCTDAAMDSNGLLFAQKLSWRATNHNSSIFHRDTEAPPTAAQQRSGPCTVHRIPLHTSMPNFTHWKKSLGSNNYPPNYVFLALSMRSSFRCLRFAFFRAICSSFNSTDDAQNAAQRRGTIMAQKPRSQGHGSSKTVMTIASSLVAFCVNRWNTSSGVSLAAVAVSMSWRCRVWSICFVHRRWQCLHWYDLFDP